MDNSSYFSKTNKNNNTSPYVILPGEERPSIGIHYQDSTYFITGSNFYEPYSLFQLYNPKLIKSDKLNSKGQYLYCILYTQTRLNEDGTTPLLRSNVEITDTDVTPLLFSTNFPITDISQLIRFPISNQLLALMSDFQTKPQGFGTNHPNYIGNFSHEGLKEHSPLSKEELTIYDAVEADRIHGHSPLSREGSIEELVTYSTQPDDREMQNVIQATSQELIKKASSKSPIFIKKALTR